ncbi:M24 family metallopeptidase [Kineococcus rhizosphaerae]|uniref:M24 family metallopeptidase n=1 Tax=Kineococcus rhizosphaerae TaxID=559628 RepID=UPI001B7FFE23|nr:M24 family metallopeptidase [Kineococcus rhizosphaerae]
MSSAVGADRPEKRRRLRELLDRTGHDAVLLTTGPTLAWYLDGTRVDVGAGAAPVLAVEADGRDDVVHCALNEVERLEAGELPPDVRVHPVPWTTPPALAAPDGLVPEESLAAELRAARARLLPAERARYRALGRTCAGVLTRALLTAEPGESENSLAARVGGLLLAEGIDVLVLLVAGQDRLGLRHPVPGPGPLGRRAVVVVCGRRHGLIADLTRWVAFDAPDARTAGATGAVLQVEADAFAACTPGRALADVLADVAAAYPRHGLAADEWTRHHQGGPTGYAGRDPRATPHVPDRVVAGGAFAWNPTAPAVKVEDTVVLDEAGIEVLTVDPHWPTVEVRGLARPAELQR